jgi:hypothetical protein
MSNAVTLVIASASQAVQRSLEHLCQTLGIATGTTGTTWLVDGHHLPNSLIPKEARTLILGPIPKQIQANVIIPTPAPLHVLKEILLRESKLAQMPLRNHWAFDIHQRSITHPESAAVSLTEKEAGLLHYLLQHAGQDVSSKELLKEIWSVDKNVDTHTVETHIYRLRQKMNDTIADIITSDTGYKVVI